MGKYVPSNIGVRYYIGAPDQFSSFAELKNIISAKTFGKSSKQTKEYALLNGGGYPIYALGMNKIDTVTVEAVRDNDSDAYVGTAVATDTYTVIRNWHDTVLATASAPIMKRIIEVIPMADGNFEGTAYDCLLTDWTPGDKNVDIGQEFSFGLQPTGADMPVTVTYTAQTDTFAFAAI